MIDLDLAAEDRDGGRGAGGSECAPSCSRTRSSRASRSASRTHDRQAARRRRHLSWIERRSRRRLGARRGRSGSRDGVAPGRRSCRPARPAVVLPGGFAYGDYLRTGAMASVAPVMDAVRAFAAAGGPVLGICNGFQVLCEARLLPGVLRPNRQLEFVCEDVTVRVESADAPFMRRCSPGQELVIPVKHGEGAWYADEGTFVQLAARGQIVLRYTDDVNGALGNVAGVVNEAGNVMGAHAPSRARRRPAARLGRRRAPARGARRRRGRVPSGARPRVARRRRSGCQLSR